MGEEWDLEIHDSLSEDCGGVVQAAIAEFCPKSADAAAIDFGCGVGKYLPLLAQHTARVVGLDISRRLLAVARKSCDAEGCAERVRLQRADLGLDTQVERLGLPRVAFAICVNVLISPEPVTRDAILGNVAAALLPGAHLLLVVPAVRSALLSQRARRLWFSERRRRGVKARPAFDPCEATSAADEAAGVYRREGVRTKHFRQAELRTLLRRAGFDEVVAVRRVEYGWHTEFPDTLDALEVSK